MATSWWINTDVFRKARSDHPHSERLTTTQWTYSIRTTIRLRRAISHPKPWTGLNQTPRTMTWTSIRRTHPVTSIRSNLPNRVHSSAPLLQWTNWSCTALSRTPVSAICCMITRKSHSSRARKWRVQSPRANSPPLTRTAKLASSTSTVSKTRRPAQFTSNRLKRKTKSQRFSWTRMSNSRTNKRWDRTKESNIFWTKSKKLKRLKDLMQQLRNSCLVPYIS